MDFQIGDIVQFKSLDLDYVSKDTWERIGRLSNLDSKYSLGHDYEVISVLGNYLVIRSNRGVTFDIPKEYFKLIATKGFRIGDRIKTLKAFPNGGNVLKDEIGTIVGWSPILYKKNSRRAIMDFPGQSNYYAEIANSEKYTKVISDYEDLVVFGCVSAQSPIPPNPNITPSGLVEIPKPKKKKKEILVLSTKNITV